MLILRRRLVPFLVASTLSASLPSLAAPAAQGKRHKAKVQTDEESDAYDAAELAPTNHALRARKSWYLLVDAFGFTLLPTVGFRGGWYATPDLAVEVTRGAAVWSDSEEKNVKTLTEVKLKYFVLDNFYVDGGLASEQWQSTYQVQQTAATSASTTSAGSNPTYVNEDGTLVNYGVEFHIGNQWQWKSFTMGCDWIGFMYAVSTTSKLGQRPDVDQTDQASRQDSLKRSLGGSSLHLLRLYLGAAF